MQLHFLARLAGLYLHGSTQNLPRAILAFPSYQPQSLTHVTQPWNATCSPECQPLPSATAPHSGDPYLFSRLSQPSGMPWRRNLHSSPGGGHKDEGTPAEEWLQLPNLLSLSRVAAGPVVAYMILQEAWIPAGCLLAASGATDWLDGYMARKQGIQSVLGSYLDPLGDKVLICCVVGALTYKTFLPLWLATVIIGRDLLLIGGGFALRFRQVGWKWPGAAEFFATGGGGSSNQVEGGDTGSSSSSSAVRMQPLWISKFNTVLQLLLVAGCLSQGVGGWPPQEVVDALMYTTAGTTAVSCGAYAYKFAKQRMAA